MIDTQITCHFLKANLIFFFFLLNSCNDNNSSNHTLLNDQSDSLIVKGHTNNGLKNGEWVSYFSNGNVQSICHFKQGIPDGSIMVYDESGEELYRGNFKEGEKVGEWVFTNPSDKTQTVKNYSSN